MKKYENFPTIMDYKDQIAAIRDLIDIGAPNLIQDREGLIFILSKIEDSHQDNGVFEFKQADDYIFQQFVKLLRELDSVDPRLGLNVKNMIFTFSNPSFN